MVRGWGAAWKVAGIVLLIPTLLYAFDRTERLALDTCAPDGIFNAVKEKIAPKAFWVNQDALLEIQLSRYRGNSAIEACHDIQSGHDRALCMTDWTSRKRTLTKCYEASKQMCKAHGGSC